MARRVRGNSHARCRVGEKLEITSKTYLSLFYGTLTIVHTADSLEELDNDTESLTTTAGKHMCQLVTLKYQQYDGLSTAMPSGVKRINTKRTLTTESLAVFMPFKVQEIQDTQGVYYGKNVIS